MTIDKETILTALVNAYRNAGEAPLYSDMEQSAHRSGVRDVAVRLGIYDDLMRQLDEKIYTVPADRCAYFDREDKSCGACGDPSLDYSTPCRDGKDVCGLALKGKCHPVAMENDEI